MKEFGLNPLHYVGRPGYSFDCWLMSSGVTLDTLQDRQLLDDFVEAKRGGICGIMGHRYINSNNNRNSKNNGEARTKSHSNSNRSIWYIDTNNLYGYAMMQKLPYKDFKYSDASSDEGETTLQRILNTCEDRTKQLALMPNKRKINDNELGYIERGVGKARSEKLVSDQNNKTEYLVHYRLLKFYVKMGVKITKFHRVIKFKQDYISRDYIQNNTNKRATAKTEAEKDVRKLMNNALYGRMCLNPLHFLQSKFLHDEEKIMKIISKSIFKIITRCIHYSQIECIEKKIEYDSPVYVDVTILELSKLHIYDVFYNIF